MLGLLVFDIPDRGLHFDKLSLNLAIDFEFLSGMLLPQKINGSSSFYKTPQTCKVLGPLQKLLFTPIYI